MKKEITIPDWVVITIKWALNIWGIILFLCGILILLGCLTVIIPNVLGKLALWGGVMSLTGFIAMMCHIMDGY